MHFSYPAYKSEVKIERREERLFFAVTSCYTITLLGSFSTNFWNISSEVTFMQKRSDQFVIDMG